MQNLYTEALVNFLVDHEQSIEWQGIKEKFNNFPSFTLQALNFNMYDLFIEKYNYREIGCENDEMFYFFINNKLNELLIKFGPKIQMYLDNFNKLVDRKVELNETGSTENKLYPLTSTRGKTVTQVNFNGNKEQALIFFRSNAEVLQQALEIKDVYLDALSGFETCFMGVY